MQAAAEIDRIGGHPGIVAIILPCGAPRAFGQRFYNPIFEACERNNLTVALHFATEGTGVNPPPTSAGYPTYYCRGAPVAAGLLPGPSRQHGVRGLVRAVPDPEGRHARRRLRLGAVVHLEDGPGLEGAPLADPVGQAAAERVPCWSGSASPRSRWRSRTRPRRSTRSIEWMDGKNTLMFASDYPHWDWDDPKQTLTQLAPELRHRIFVENALDGFPKLRATN